MGEEKEGEEKDWQERERVERGEGGGSLRKKVVGGVVGVVDDGVFIVVLLFREVVVNDDDGGGGVVVKDGSWVVDMIINFDFGEEGGECGSLDERLWSLFCCWRCFVVVSLIEEEIGVGVTEEKEESFERGKKEEGRWSWISRNFLNSSLPNKPFLKRKT